MSNVKRQPNPETTDRPQTRQSILARPQGGRVPTFQRQPAAHGRQNLAFTGRGFIPDYMSETALTMFPEASRTTLEVEGVYGESGMMPPAGLMTKLQAGQELDNGSGGAGSFVTAPALNAKVNG
jgi:hypothetical protein